ncbi:aquaporin [Candidatus Micrarchaeota archaeon]|nr:aquaporin [Candidatus Micrarchaeota archaeon]
MDLKKYLAEFLGAFALIFIGAGAVLVNGLTGGAVGLVGIALAHGLVLMTMIYGMAHISGAHFNPAVTIAMLANKRINLSDAAGYILSQLTGAGVAGFLLFFLYPTATSGQLYGFPTTIGLGFGIALEAVLTFFLVLTIYGTAVNKKAPSGFFGLAIGSVLIYDIILGGTQTGAAMNPARAFGPALASGVWGPQLIYWVGPVLGGLLASFVYEYLIREE